MRGMRPVTFAGCFGWLHSGPADRGGDVAVLLCPALTRDALDAHLPFRLLASELAVAGYPTLRFDYPGTGNSGDASDDPWETWQAAIDDAVAYLRRTTGARRVVFAGLRIGATLAALAAARHPEAAGLLLLAPVLRGQSFMRQLAVEAQLQAAGATPGLTFHELHLSAAGVAHIAQIDLRTLTMPAALKITVFSQAPSTLLTTCTAAWTAAGAAVTTAGFDGLDPLLMHNLVDEVPTPDFSAPLAWLRDAIPPAPAPLPPQPELAPLHATGWTETPLRFGNDGQLSGMLCRPTGPAAETCVIIGNTGRDPQHGFARFGVAFARQLADAGFASLRMDFAGLGDSFGPPGRELAASHMFELDRRPDLAAAMAALEPLGFGRFAVNGTCAGAYHALHAACDDPRIDTLLLVNLPLFTWTPGDTVDFSIRKTSGPGRYLAQIGRTDFWRRLVAGEVHVGRFLRGQALRGWQFSRPWRRRLGGLVGRVPTPTDAERAMTTLAAHGTRTLFLFAPDDVGFDAFKQAFGPGGCDARHFPGVETILLENVDHILTQPHMRRAATDVMLAFLSR